MSNYFEQLNNINVNDKTEKKNGLTYLSWAWAWGEVKKMFPDATYTIYEDANGCFYHTDGKTCWVKTGVTVNGIEHIEYLPVMDYRNKSISADSVTSFDVNKAIQRSLTKAVARHGLGLYIYAGEDLPEAEAEQESKQETKSTLNKASNLKASPKQVEILKDTYKGNNLAKLLEANNITQIEDLPMAKASELIAKLKQKAEEKTNVDM